MDLVIFSTITNGKCNRKKCSFNQIKMKRYSTCLVHLDIVLPIYLSGGTTLVSSLQALLVQEEFYSIRQCTVIVLFGVSWLLLSVTGIQQSGKRKRNQNIT